MKLNNDVKKFACYGNGWALYSPSTGKQIRNIDLSKLEWNKGYTLSFENFGVLDPVFGDYETDLAWNQDGNFVKYLLKTNNLIDAWLNNERVKRRATEDLGVEANKENLELIVENAIDEDPDFIIETLNSLNFGKEFAICGVTDEDYFKDLIVNIGYDPEDPALDVVFLG